MHEMGKASENLRQQIGVLKKSSPVSYITGHNLGQGLEFTERDITLTPCTFTAFAWAHRVNQVICVTTNPIHLQNPEGGKKYWGTPNVEFERGDFDSRPSKLKARASQVILKDLQSDLKSRHDLKRAIEFAGFCLRTKGLVIITLFDPGYLEDGNTKRNAVQQFDRIEGNRIQRHNFSNYEKTNAFPEIPLSDYDSTLRAEGFNVILNAPFEVPHDISSPWHGDRICPYRLLIGQK